MTQLDLFVHYQTPADVVIFPFCRRISLARSIAAELSAIDVNAGRKHWQTVCREVRKGLRRDGLSTEAIKAEIDGLADAVHEELRIPQFPKQIKSPTLIVSLTVPSSSSNPHGYSGGAAGAPVPRAAPLGGYGLQAHDERSEYDAARACDGDAA
ncbi:DUF6074 family protein [Sinorhizobium fredii]|uniref:DUF6074 family protein n=1 Tax=Rhizobium fredii TaxID=380 RepID=UPI00351164EE